MLRHACISLARGSAPACSAARSSLAASARPAAAAAAPRAASLCLSRGMATKAAPGGKGGAKGGAKGGKDGKGGKELSAADKAKAKKKKKVGQAGPATGGGVKVDVSGLEEMLEQQLNLQMEADPRTPAELALDTEYAKEHSRRLMAEHNARRAEEQQFLRARWMAVNALPTPLRKLALVEDMAPWPKHFQPIPWTPQEYVKRFGNSGGAVKPGEQVPGMQLIQKTQGKKKQ